MLPGLAGFAGFATASAASALSYGVFDSWTTTSANTSFTSGSLSIGAAPSGGQRRFVVAVCGTNAGANNISISSATIGGSAATQAANAANVSSGSCNAAIFFREIPTGTTTTVSFSCSGLSAGANVLIATIITGAGGLALRQGYTDPADSNPSITYDAFAGDLVIGGTHYRNGRVSSFDGLIFLGEEPGDSADYTAMGYREVSSTLTSEVESPNASVSGAEECFALAVFRP